MAMITTMYTAAQYAFSYVRRKLTRIPTTAAQWQ